MTITRTALRPFLLQSTISRPSTLSRYPSLPSRPFLKIPALSFESPRVLNRMSSSGTSSGGGHLWGEPLAEPNETYLVLLPDLKDSKRLEVRAQHLEDAKQAFANGHFIEAGALLSPLNPDESNPNKMEGTWLLVRASSVEDLKRRLNADIYVRGGAWDMDKTEIRRVARAKH